MCSSVCNLSLWTSRYFLRTLFNEKYLVWSLWRRYELFTLLCLSCHFFPHLCSQHNPMMTAILSLSYLSSTELSITDPEKKKRKESETDGPIFSFFSYDSFDSYVSCNKQGSNISKAAVKKAWSVEGKGRKHWIDKKTEKFL